MSVGGILKDYWFLIIICIFIFIKSSASHKKGYIIFFIWFYSRKFSFGENFEDLIQRYEILNTVYFALCWILKIYCIIGIFEAAIRFFSKEFTFIGWIKKYIFHFQEKNDKQTEDTDHHQIESITESGVGEHNKDISTDFKQEIGSDAKPQQNNVSNTDEVPISKPLEYCMNHIFMISKRRKFWDSNIEMKAYFALRSFIDDAYIILPHVAFREIFYWGKWESDWKLTDRVTKMHFDFGIYNERLQPVLFIELYGKQHYDNPEVMERDKFKAELMKKCGLKLIAIDFSESIADNEIADKLIQRIKEEVPNREAYPAYCPHCDSLMEIKQNNFSKEYFYGCETYKKGSKDNCPTTNISDVPPLYRGMSIK